MALDCRLIFERSIFRPLPFGVMVIYIVLSGFRSYVSVYPVGINKTDVDELVISYPEDKSIL